MNEEDTDEAGFEVDTSDTEVTFSMDLSGADDGEINGIDDDLDGDIDESGERDGVDNDNDGDIDEEDEIRIGDGQVDGPGERIRYFVSNGFLIRDDLNDAVDCTGTPLPQCRLIDNIDALNFVYFDGGDPAASPPVPPQRIATPVVGGNLKKIRSIEITLLVHTTNEDYRYTDKNKYYNLRGEEIFDAVTDAIGDDRHKHRRVATSLVKIRNMNL